MRPEHLMWAVVALVLCNAQTARGAADESLDELRKKKVEAAVEWVKLSSVDWEIP